MSAYTTLESRFRQLSSIEGASAILHWDAATMMPTGANAVRGDQLAALAEIAHEKLLREDMPDLFAHAEQDVSALNEWQRANLREMRHRYLHAAALPQSLVAALTRTRLASEHQWRQSKADNDYASFAPLFGEVIALTREAAQAKSEALGLTPYEALLDSYDGGLRCADIDPLFADLRTWLPSLVDDVIAHQRTHPALPLNASIPISKQEALGRELMAALGFDFTRGRIDTSAHPFCGGVPGDVRLTTRYREDAFTDSLYGVLHETGHALYEMGLPADWRGLPVADARGMTAHESQSLLVEMQLALSPAFLQFLVPKLHATFGVSGEAWGAENLTRHLTHVSRSFIRVSADEVTYPLHVMLRYELEKSILAGDVQVNDIPDAWDNGFEALFGLRPPTLAEGCLQDIHWPEGMFGYFPTYSLGAMLAAQLFARFKAEYPAWESDIARGHFLPLTTWLGEVLHSKASLLSTPELIRSATGAPLSTSAFRAHLHARYLQ